jgi:hypothetical protein
MQQSDLSGQRKSGDRWFKGLLPVEITEEVEDGYFNRRCSRQVAPHSTVVDLKSRVKLMLQLNKELETGWNGQFRSCS